MKKIKRAGEVLLTKIQSKIWHPFKAALLQIIDHKIWSRYGWYGLTPKAIVKNIAFQLKKENILSKCKSTDGIDINLVEMVLSIKEIGTRSLEIAMKFPRYFDKVLFRIGHNFYISYEKRKDTLKMVLFKDMGDELKYLYEQEL